MVHDFMKSNLEFFSGKALEAESTILPAKIEKDEEDDKQSVKDEDDNEDDDAASDDNEKENPEEADIRDMRHRHTHQRRTWEEPSLMPRKCVKLAITHHTISSDEKVVNEKPICFLMDPPKDREEGGKPAKKKQKKNTDAGTMTNKNFGSILDISKLKSCNRLLVGWRVRLTCC
eukprot:Skav224319  [mRNA]  locus=scaffold227:508757:513150:+ [translate_table: standard]